MEDNPFQAVESHYYWSSTTNAYYPTKAWLVEFIDGKVAYADKSSYNYVWCVRGGP